MNVLADSTRLAQSASIRARRKTQVARNVAPRRSLHLGRFTRPTMCGKMAATDQAYTIGKTHKQLHHLSA